MTAPDPLTSIDMDLTKIDGFMLDTARLLGSELVAISTGDEFKAAVLLWARAWQQRPCCSLPNDDRVLASFAMVPRAKWSKIRDVALRGFVLCSDGRLYHKVLAEDAARAWKAVSQRREAIRKRYDKPTAVDTTELRSNDARTTRDGRGTGEGRDESKEERKISIVADAARAPETRMPPDWQPSAEILQFAMLKCIPDSELAEQTELFRDHYLAKGFVAADWSARFRLWLNRRKQFIRPTAATPTNGSQRHDAIRKAFDEFDAYATGNTGENQRDRPGNAPALPTPAVHR